MRRAERLLDEVECSILPSDPYGALLMLTAFVEGNERALWRRPDVSGVPQLFTRAMALARTAAMNLPAAEWRSVVERSGVAH